MRIKRSNLLILALIASALAGCSRETPEDNSVPKSATIEIQSNLRTQHKTIQAPVVVEVTDPAVVHKLRKEFAANPKEASGRKGRWTAVGSVTFLDDGGEATKFLFGVFDWALIGEDNEHPLPEGFKDRLIEVIEAIQSKE
jgi:hypothetical protein